MSGVNCARPILRSIRIAAAGAQDIFKQPVHGPGGIIFNAPLLPKGAVYGPSIVTNGVAVSLPYVRARTVAGRMPTGAAKQVAGAPAPAAGGKRSRADADTLEEAAPPRGGAPPRQLTADEARAARPLAEQERVVAVDAGATWIAYTLENVTDPTTGAAREVFTGLSTREWRARRGDEARLEQTRGWCKALAAPGGAFCRLATVSRRTTSVEKFLAYCLIAHGAAGVRGAHDDVLDERLKPRWARAAFRTWSLGQSILTSFWACIRAGRLEDGTYGVRPVIVYGSAAFAATGRGRHSSPTTTMRAACVAACGAAWTRDADEHRSSKCCSACGCVLTRVESPTPYRVYAAAAAKAARELPFGWKRPPARPVRAWRVVRGLLYCGQDACRERPLRHRDGDACRLILDNALAVDAGRGTLDCMRKGKHADDVVPPRFVVWE